MRRITLAALLASLPAAALADGTMPQMDFQNPLTTAQLFWMVVILVVLYVVLARWGLPRMGAVLANRASVIARDLAAARLAKTEADDAVANLNATMRAARADAQTEIAKAVAGAKAQAAAAAIAASARLDAQLAESERQIGAARAAAMAAIKPVAETTAGTMLARLTGRVPGAAAVADEVDAALARRQAA